MSISNARRATGGGIPDGTRGPDDDFFCHKYEVWYRIEDCVYRGRNRTFAGCVNCFQGYLNIRSLEKGIQPPTHLGPRAADTAGNGVASIPNRHGALVPFSSPTRDPRDGTGA